MQSVQYCRDANGCEDDWTNFGRLSHAVRTSHCSRVTPEQSNVVSSTSIVLQRRSPDYVDSDELDLMSVFVKKHDAVCVVD